MKKIKEIFAILRAGIAESLLFIAFRFYPDSEDKEKLSYFLDGFFTYLTEDKETEALRKEIMNDPKCKGYKMSKY
ncbi:MAG: hypothetical protein GY928_25905 [Colwellia sp.]|nr:hypothetical protein [Colwellia sp.]